MRSEKPNHVELTVDVEEVGGGQVKFRMGDHGITIPATLVFQKWAGAHLYKRVILTIVADDPT